MGNARNHAYVKKDGFLLRKPCERDLSLVSPLADIVKDKSFEFIPVYRYVKTNILSEEAFQQALGVGIEFATLQEAGECLLRVLSDASVNGHSFFISGKKWAPRGYLDLDLEAYPGNSLIQEIQEDQVKANPLSIGLFV